MDKTTEFKKLVARVASEANTTLPQGYQYRYAPYNCWKCGKGTPKYNINEDDVNTREYAKYVLREGTPLEKRELLGHLRSRLVLKDKKITLVEE